MKCEWKKVKISDVCKICYGKDHKQLLDGNVPAYGSGGIIRRVNKSIHEKKSVLIPRKGSLDNLFFVDPPFWTVDTLFWTDIDETKINPAFFFYQLKTLDLASKNVGTAVPSLTTSVLNDIEINLPSMDIQKKIAAILSALDEKIAINRAINDNLYEMVNAYYTYLFKDIECEMTTIGSYVKRIYSGGTPTTTNAAYWNGSFGWFSSGETRNRFVISTEKTITQAGVDNSSTKLAKKHDIVMASAGQGFTRGQTSMLLLDTYVNQSVIVIHAERNVLPYLFWNLANRYEELRAISDSSSIRGSLTTKMISAFELPHANEDSLQAFADFAWSVIPRIENNLLENERLAAIRDSLLPKLMSGEIDVVAIRP